MITIPYHSQYSGRVGRGIKPDQMPCVVCGKGIGSRGNLSVVRVWWGSELVTDVEADALIADGQGGGDTGYYPIGPDCLRQHPELEGYVKRDP